MGMSLENSKISQPMYVIKGLYFLHNFLFSLSIA